MRAYATHPPQAPITQQEWERWAEETARFAWDFAVLDILKRAVDAFCAVEEGDPFRPGHDRERRPGGTLVRSRA